MSDLRHENTPANLELWVALSAGREGHGVSQSLSFRGFRIEVIPAECIPKCLYYSSGRRVDNDYSSGPFEEFFSRSIWRAYLEHNIK